MKILLLGGTGAMGAHLANVLSGMSKKVVVTSRRRKPSKKSIKYVQGDAKNLSFLNNILLEKWDVIVDFMIYSEDEFQERINLFLDSTKRYVFLSSARVYNCCEGAIVEESPRLLDSSEDEEFLLTREYSLVKARQEDMLYASSKKNWTIVRPYITYSEYRLQLGTFEKEGWLYRALQGRTIVFSEDIAERFTTLTYGFDVAAGIANIVNDVSSLGQTFHITNESACTWSDVLEIYLNVLEDRLGKRPKVLLQDLPDFLCWNHGKYQIKYDRLFDRKFDNTKVNEFIDTQEFTPAKSGLVKCLNTFLDDPKFNRISWKNEAIKDRFCNERTPLKEIYGIKEKIKYLIFRYSKLV
ncbi:MAG: NAD-dependent epimerase/dehydratase family protein [Erysipelothrix sp.]|nr:NAD-dependent epimerase/dehydratase family protein [Erysipelothrix sp.]